MIQCLLVPQLPHLSNGEKAGESARSLWTLSPFLLLFPYFTCVGHVCMYVFLYMWVHVNVCTRVQLLCGSLRLISEITLDHSSTCFFFFEGRSQSNPELVGLANLP